MAKLKPKHIKQGTVLYHAFAFPRSNGEPSVAWYETVKVLERPRPFTSRYHSKPLLGFKCIEGDYGLRERAVWVESVMSAESLSDTFHRMFRTPRQAQRYVDRMERGCLTALERKRLEKYEEQMRLTDWHDAQARAYATE